MSRYLVDGIAIIRVNCDDPCCTCGGWHREKESIVIVIDALDQEEAAKEALKRKAADSWVDEPVIILATSADIVRTADQERKALQAWQEAASWAIAQ